MTTEPTPIKDCLIIHPTVYEDERGYFFERYNQQTFIEQTGLRVNFVQDNESLSSYGVLRGLHAQSGEHAQAKLVEVSRGKVFDVVVDARPKSNTFGQHFSIELSEKNKRQLFVPRGLLHGFAVLSETAKFVYKCDNFYQKSAEYGVHYDDASLAIDWKIPAEKRIISPKDQALPSFKSLTL